MNVDSLRPPGAALPLSRALPGSVVVRAATAYGGMALFGLAMAVSPGWQHPRHPRVAAAPAAPDGRHLAGLSPRALRPLGPAARRRCACLRSCAPRGASFATAGSCLGATAPILWFFAATAPESSVGPALGFVFGWFALLGAGVTFGRALRDEALVLPGPAQLGFFALFTLTFFQFSAAAGLTWF